ncbi:MAG: glycosyltransferase family 4 protein, partial [Rhodothermales bacterium]|nr:glycosyltransferase family 4 protein [Rhodothermales bacterium]
PEIGYGVFASSWRAPIARFVFRRLSLLLPTTESLMSSTNRYSEYPREHADGVLTHIPDLAVPHRVVPLGIATGMWPMGPEVRQRVVLTVAYIRDERTFRVKGLDLFLAVAPMLPDVTFRVVGVVPEFAKSVAGHRPLAPNVELLPPRPQSELVAQYQSASVYAQLSRTEALPNVVKEAMCCGCIPVGSAVVGIPEVIGDAGYIVETPELETIAETLRAALSNASPEGRVYARQRILETFGNQRRKELLTDCLTEMVQSPTQDRS